VPGAGTDENPGPWLIVGLGNPGREYEGHRHNVGFLVADELALRNRGTFRKHKRSRSLVLEGRLSDRRAVLVKPTTYMNDSGQAVAPLCDFYGVSPDRVVAIHDELDLPFRSMRLKFAGGDNGHNGLRSLRQSFGTGDFYRLDARSFFQFYGYLRYRSYRSCDI
jgi:PTH1 family peptidyl-tRNA hydrolase